MGFEIDVLQECFSLSDSGALVWRERPRAHFRRDREHRAWNTTFSGKEAGWSNGRGYKRLHLTIRGEHRQLVCHRVVWALVHGRWPETEIDHINGVGNDNRPDNLREATHQLNLHNSVKGKRNTSGFLGVGWDRRKEKWRAQITVEWKNVFLGYFATKEEAYRAYLKAREVYRPFQPIPREAV